MAPNPKSLLRTLSHRRPHTIKPRDIKPRVPKQPSMANLNHDTIILVVYHLYDLDPQSLNNLALVCSNLYNKARYVQHQQISIGLDNQTVEQIHSIVRNDFLPAIRSLHVTAPIEHSYERDGRKLELAAWKQLADFVPAITGLRDLHWTGAAIPDSVLEHLDKHSRIRLHLSLGVTDMPGAQNTWVKQLPDRLAGSQNLSSIRIEVSYGWAERCRPITQSLKQLVVSSPILRKLSLDISPPRGGCGGMWEPEAEYCGFGLSKGESLPPLEELEVIAYPWGEQPTVSGWGINCRGYPEPTGTEMEYWAQNSDWSKLRRLHLEGSSTALAEHLAPQLTALEEVEFKQPTHTEIVNFFAHVPSILTTIDLPFIRGIDISTITAHGSKLHTLSIHRDPLTAQELSLLSDSLPHLEDLTVVCSRNTELNTWPHDALSILTTFSQLRRLEIWFDIGPPSAPYEPYLTVSSAREIFADLLQHSPKLRRLHIHSGFPPEPFEGYPADEAFWPGDNMTSFICEAAGDGNFSVTCPNLSRTENRRLRDVAQRRGSWGKEEELPFLVALSGPMKVEAWLSWRERILW